MKTNERLLKACKMVISHIKNETIEGMEGLSPAGRERIILGVLEDVVSLAKDPERKARDNYFETLERGRKKKP